MKEFFIRIIKWKVKHLARLTLWRYQPSVIGVTGSVGKTSAKLAIGAVLGADRHVRISSGNFNNELGLPLTILGDWPAIKGLFFWPKVMLTALKNLIIPTSYPELIVLEYGVDHPGDMRELTSIARPNVGVITAIGDIPVHVEFFETPESLVREKARLIEALPAASFAILNYDNDIVMSVKDRTRAHVVTFGFDKGADVEILSFEHRFDGDRPIGINFKLSYAGTTVPVRLDGPIGRAQAYACGAAAAVGITFGMNLVKIADALKSYRPLSGRMEFLDGLKGVFILNDAYNASPLSMHAALDTLRSLPGKRKIGVLGDMLELGRFSVEAHERVGRLAAHIVDILVTVGPRAKFIAEAARHAGMNKKDIYEFESAEEAHPKVQELMKKGDLVLVKASRGIHLEKVVEEIRVV